MRRNQKKGLPYAVVGALLIVVVSIATYLAFTRELPFRDFYTVKAVFKSANNIKPNSPVRVAGVNVGKVVAVESTGAGEQSASVEMRIQKSGLPLHEDAEFKVRPRIFLEGNFFVDVEPGSPSADVVDEDHVFPINQTAAPVQIDQVLSALQSDTRADLKKLLGSLATGFGGQGSAGFNRSVQYFTPAYRDSAIVNEATLGINDRDLSGYIEGAGATAEALDRNAPQLKALITNLNRTFNAFAVRDDELRDGLEELPRTLKAAMPALSSLNAAFPAVRRLAVDFRPGVRSSGPAIDASLPFIREVRDLVSRPELRGLTADLRPTVPNLANLNDVTVPLLKSGRQLSSCQNEVVLPLANDTVPDPTFPAGGKVFEDSVKTLPGLAGESRSGDANGQWFRVLLSAGNFVSPSGPGGQVMLTSQPIMGVNPPVPAQRSPLRSDVPCETQEPPDLRTIPGQVQGQRRARVSPENQGEYERIQAEAITWLRGVSAVPSGKNVRVTSPTLSEARIAELTKQPDTKTKAGKKR